MPSYSHTIQIDADRRLEATLEACCWEAYYLGERRVIRSPDRKVFILHDRCTSEDCLEIIYQWQFSQAPQGRLNQ